MKKKVRTDSGRPYLPKYAEVSYGVLVSKRIRMEHLLVHSHDTTMPYAEVRREHLTPPGKNQKKKKEQTVADRTYPSMRRCRKAFWYPSAYVWSTYWYTHTTQPCLMQKFAGNI